MRNTPESREERYGLYLAQMECIQSRVAAAFDVLDRKGLWDDALVIVNGDHGSRISLWEPIPENVGRLGPADYADLFSALFVVKRAGVPARYDRRILPLDHLFKRVVLDEGTAGDPALEDAPSIFLQMRDQEIREFPLPPFGGDRP